MCLVRLSLWLPFKEESERIFVSCFTHLLESLKLQKGCGVSGEVPAELNVSRECEMSHVADDIALANVYKV